MANLLRTTRENWDHGRWAKIERVTFRLSTRFVCLRCRVMTERMEGSIEKLCDEVETVNEFF